MKKIALYAGSFDPFTLGHLDIIKRVSKFFDKVFVCAFKNYKKEDFLTKEEKIRVMEEIFEDMPNVEGTYFDGLVVEFAKLVQASILIRGVRNTLDLRKEMDMALANKKLFDDIETVFMVSKPEYSFLSSSFVKELVYFKKDVSQFVPSAVNDIILRKNSNID